MNESSCRHSSVQHLCTCLVDKRPVVCQTEFTRVVLDTGQDCFIGVREFNEHFGNSMLNLIYPVNVSSYRWGLFSPLWLMDPFYDIIAAHMVIALIVHTYAFKTLKYHHLIHSRGPTFVVFQKSIHIIPRWCYIVVSKERDYYMILTQIQILHISSSLQRNITKLFII